jgi:hypothetical protein
MMSEPLPFASYPKGGRTLLDKPKSGDGSARGGYGRDVLVWCGFRCAYCDLDMSLFEGWLQLSVDHVVPQQAWALGYRKDWLRNPINTVACCRPCNDLYNREQPTEPAPATLEAFLEIRDATFRRRKARLLEHREAERAKFGGQVHTPRTGA